MTEATEGVDLGRLRPCYLRRNIAPQNAKIEAAYDEVYGNLKHFDEQTAFITPDSYKVILHHDFGWVREQPEGARPGKVYEAGRMEENEKFREKYVRNTAWMKDQRAEDVERRKAGWERGIREGIFEFDD